MDLRTAPPDRRVLRDRGANRRLHRDGFLVVRVMSAEAAEALRAQYGELHGWDRHQLLDEQAPDFEGDFWNRDLDYRRAISDAVITASAAGIDRLLVHHRPLGGSCLVRWPSDQDDRSWTDVPNRFHTDASFLDERSGHRSYMVWVALQHIDASNGGMDVVPATHRIERPLRGIDFEAPWISHTETFVDRAVAVTLEPGEAIIFDPALVHRSGPNSTAIPRIAATMLVVPPGAPLGYYRSVDESTAERVEIDPRFFLDAQVADMASRPPADRLPIDPLDIEADELARRLDLLTRGRRFRRSTSAR